MTYKLVLLRHGQSLWNQENRFTGWYDVNLTEKGCQEARQAGQLLQEAGFRFDLGYTSLLQRAIRTLWIALDEMDQLYLQVDRHWRLNERHYGALQGLNKAETAEEFGNEQVLIWRRSFDVPPPALDDSSPYYPGHDPRYAHLDPRILPRSECLKDVVERVLPYWQDEIVPNIQAGKQIIIAAHGNSLRALVQYLDQLNNDEVLKLNIPTGVPLVYELDQQMQPVNRYYLGDQTTLAAKVDAVAQQGKA